MCTSSTTSEKNSESKQKYLAMYSVIPIRRSLLTQHNTELAINNQWYEAVKETSEWVIEMSW